MDIVIIRLFIIIAILKGTFTLSEIVKLLWFCTHIDFGRHVFSNQLAWIYIA